MKIKKQKRMSDEELREYYDRTSTLNEGGKIRSVNLTFTKPVALRRRRLVALRLEEDTLAAIQRIALDKGINYSTLMRMWITERLRKET